MTIEQELADAGAAAREVLGELAHDMTAADVIRDLARERQLLRGELLEARELAAEERRRAR